MWGERFIGVMLDLFKRLSRLSDSVSNVAWRFPLALIIALLLTLLFIGGIWEGRNVLNSSLALLALFFANVGFSLRGEAEDKPQSQATIFTVVFGALLGILFVYADQMLVSAPALVGGILLAASGAPYRGVTRASNSYWFFNYRFWTGLVASLIAGSLIAGILLLLLVAFAALFDMQQQSSAQQYVTVICLFFIAPLIWLSLMPKSFDKGLKVAALEKDMMLKILGIGVKYVLIPAFFIFAALFHGLLFKIYMDNELPDGQVGWFGLVLGFGAILTYLIGYPFRDTGGRLVRYFYDYWAWFLIIPALLIAAALYIRIDNLGLTTARVFMICFVLWMALLIVYSLYKCLREQTPDMRLFSGSAAVILVIMSFGFWGAEGISIWQQKKRLTDLLEKNDLLVFGQMRLPGGLKTPLSAYDTKKISSVLDYMSVGGRGETLQSLLDKNQQNTLITARKRDGALRGPRNQVMKAIRTRLDEATLTNGGGVVSEGSKRYSYRASAPFGVAIFNAQSLNGPFYFALNGQSSSSDDQVQVVREDGSVVKINFAVNGNNFLISGPNGVLARFSIEAFVDLANDHLAKLSLMKKNGTSVPLPLRIIYPQGIGRELGMKLYLTQMQYEQVPAKTPDVVINEIRFFLAGNTRLD